jgi:hypothetical protein
MNAMIERCRDMIREHGETTPDLAPPLRPKQLLARCDRLLQHVEDWPDVRIHRWIGFVQAGMLANGIVDLEGAKSMFTDAKKAFGETSADVLDHLDPDDTFEFDVGGQG